MNYDISVDVLKKARKLSVRFLEAGLLFFIFFVGFFLADERKPIFLILFILPIGLFFIGIYGIVSVNKRIKFFEELDKNGKLVKNLPYRLEDTGQTFNNVPQMRIIVNYQLPDGNIVRLIGSASGNEIAKNKDGLVDLVIDENNPDNYYIDFNINRLGGNLPTDYYDNSGGKENLQNNSF